MCATKFVIFISLGFRTERRPIHRMFSELGEKEIIGRVVQLTCDLKLLYSTS